MSAEFNPLVSITANAKAQPARTIAANEIPHWLRTGAHRPLVAKIRKGFAKVLADTGDEKAAKAAVKADKENLPGMMTSGEFEALGDKYLKTYSQLLCGDVDGLAADQVGVVYDQIASDQHRILVSVSPSGRGVKFLCRTTGDASQHKQSVAAMAKHFRDTYGIELDPSCKNVGRLCFAPDNASDWNPDAVPFKPLPIESKAERVKILAAPSIQPSNRTQIAERLLGAIEWTDEITGFCKCPGEHLHTTPTDAKHCMVKLDGVPTVSCFHGSCSGNVGGVNHELRSQIAKAEYVPTKSAPSSNRADIASDTPDANNHFKSDVGYGDAFVKRHAKSIRYCADEKIWLVFDDVTGWRRDETGTAIKSLAADYARELYQAALIEAAAKEPEIGKRIISNAAALGNKKRIDPALYFAASNPAVVVRAEQLDADPLLVGVQNGVVNLADGTFQAHRREHLVTRRLAVSFDVNATAPIWENFLLEVQPEKEIRDFLQRLCGYALTGEIREHILPFHFGTGANGKGTFLEHGFLKLASDYGAKLTDSLVYASKHGTPPHLEIANLCGKRFALGEENSESGVLNERLLKAITGGDKVKGRFHYGNFVEYFPTYKIALVGNHKPRIDGTDDGIWRRFLLVDWKIQIPEGKRDATLKDKLAVEMSGILNWCIAGARVWRKIGLNPPASCKAATAAFRDNSDKLVEFIAENFTADPDSYCTKADVFAEYRKWAEREGIKYPMSKRALGFQLINRGWQEFKQGHENSNCWRGFQLQN